MSMDKSQPASGNPASESGFGHERFLRYYSTHQRQVHGYIATFIHRPSDVDEVLQETSIVLWRKFGEFRQGANFLTWACGIARLEVYKFLRQQRRAALPLDENLLDAISDERQQMHGELEARRDALRVCITRLREDDRTLVRRCYDGTTNIKTIAMEVGRPVNSVYKSLGRIRNALLICIKKSLGMGGVS